MWDAIVEGIKAAVTWFLGLFTDMMAAAFSWLMAFVPEDIRPDIAPLVPYLKTANIWLPLDFALILFTAWFALASAMAAWRFIKQFIPTLSS